MTIFLHFKPNFLLEPYSLYHAFSTFLIAVLAYALASWLPSSQTQWLLLSSLLFSQAGLRAELNWQQAWQVLYYILCGLLAALTVWIVSLSASWLAAAPLVFIVAFSTGYLGWLNRQYYFAALVITLLAIVAAFSPCDWETAFQRNYLILLGSLLVFIVRFLFFLYQRPRALFYAKTIFFQKLKSIYQLIFYTSGQPNKLLGQELEESHFQIAWSDCLSSLLLVKAKSSGAAKAGLDRLWDLTLSLGSLRFRLTDFTVLTMSKDELQALLAALTSILDALADSKPQTNTAAALEAFQTAIQGFEELYQSMLQTLAKEPLVLLLFIQDLYALKEELEKILLCTWRGPTS